MEVTDYVGGYKLCVRVLLESFPFSYLASRGFLSLKMGCNPNRIAIPPHFLPGDPPA